RMFFKRREDFETLSAATERIFPEDDNGPGAIELGVPYFIDKQLAGSWGTNAKAYMHDPFRQNQQVKDYQHKDTRQDKSGANTSTKAPTPTPRYQTRLNRGDIFLHGLRRMEEVSHEQYGEGFLNLSEEDQDEILQNFESGEIEKIMGWKMKEYTETRIAYSNDIDADEFINISNAWSWVFFHLPKHHIFISPIYWICISTFNSHLKVLMQIQYMGEIKI